jgi:hypothetical protein
MHKSGASNLSGANIMEAFMRKHSLATCSSIVAAYTTRSQVRYDIGSALASGVTLRRGATCAV